MGLALALSEGMSMGPQNFNTTTDPAETTKGLDWIGLLATVMLGIVACVALYLHYDAIAGTAVGAIAGYVTRLYH
jgi:hypothetical protein